jgi:amino acid transporter
VFYVWTTYNYAIGVGVNDAGSAKWAGDPTIAATLATRYSGHALSVGISIAAILSAFVVCLACATAATRTMFAMGREGTLPRWFGRTHPTQKTPANATLVIAVLATIVAALVGFGWDYGNGPYTVFGLLASIGGLAVIVVYLVLCAGGLAWFRRTQRQYNVLTHALIPLIGLVVFGFGVYGSVYPGSALTMPFAIIPWVVLGWIVTGVAVLAYLRSKRPADVARIGSILGEEGGEEAAMLDEPAVSTPGAATGTQAPRA